MSRNLSVLVLELHPYHTHNFSVYSNLLPSLFHCSNVSIEYCVLPEVIDNLVFPDKKLVHGLFPSKTWQAVLSKIRLRSVYLILLIRLLSFLKKIDCVILNTLESAADKRIFRSINTKLKIAIIHNPGAIKIKREKNALYFCMNEYIFDEIAGLALLDGYLLSYFRPVEFPVRVKQDDLIIGIPGSVSFNRRDYYFLIEVCLMLAQQEKPGKKIVFNIIGDIRDKDGKELRRLIEERKLGRYFRFHEEIDDKEFSREVYECDLLMPLLGEAHARYRSVKNTATLSHSARYNRPLLLRKMDAECWDIPLDGCVIYDEADDLAELLMGMDSVSDDISSAYQRYINAKISKNRELLSEFGKRVSIVEMLG